MLLVGVMAGRAAADGVNPGALAEELIRDAVIEDSGAVTDDGRPGSSAEEFIQDEADWDGGAAEVGLQDVPVAEYIRLHVVAGDDGEAAQALKLRVRDAVLARVRELLAGCADANEAWRIVVDNLDALEAAAQARVRAEGSAATVTAEAGVFDFPDRRYGGVFVPAGEYRAVRVVIGAGEGRNWWCVLYPSLCMPEEYAPGEPVVFRSAIWDWIRSVLGGERA